MYLVELTDIKRMLLRALVTGASNKDIAQRLFKSEQTVRNQLSMLLRKSGVSNRTQAAFWYQQREQLHPANFGTYVPLRPSANL